MGSMPGVGVQLPHQSVQSVADPPGQIDRREQIPAGRGPFGPQQIAERL